MLFERYAAARGFILIATAFGPVLCGLPCGRIGDALAMASDHQFGLAPVLCTGNCRQVMQAGNQIGAGELYINPSTAHRPTPARATTPAGSAPAWRATTASTAGWNSPRHGW